jgi:hypothetical protein
MISPRRDKAFLVKRSVTIEAPCSKLQSRCSGIRLQEIIPFLDSLANVAATQLSSTLSSDRRELVEVKAAGNALAVAVQNI